MHIEKLKTHVRTHLYRAGICSDEALVALSYEELMKVRNIGHVAIAEINDTVRIPMGLKPLVRPASKAIHPKTKAGIDRYWDAYRKGNAFHGCHSRSKTRVRG